MTAVVQHNQRYGVRSADLLNVLRGTGVGVRRFLQPELGSQLGVAVAEEQAAWVSRCQIGDASQPSVVQLDALRLGEQTLDRAEQLPLAG